jgi:uncharacterized protein YndB with AHSA1/START domain
MQPQITVETTINQPIEKIWKYWNEPEHIKNWCHASDDWHAPAATNDLRVGGIFVTTMASKDGTNSFDFNGAYTTVEENKKIEYTIEGGRKVTIEFIEVEDGYKVIESFDSEDINPLEMQQTGWQSILDNFKKYITKN